MQAVLEAGPHGVNGLVAKLLQSQEADKGKATANAFPLYTAASSTSTGAGMPASRVTFLYNIRLATVQTPALQCCFIS